jgi:hypothetical protein
MYRLRTLSERKVRNRDVQAYMQRVFAEPGLPLPTNKAVQSGEVKTPRAMQQVLALFEGRGRGADLPSAKGTAYGLLNAVTEFVDHERRARGTDYRLDSAWFGQGASIKQRAMDEALRLVA